MSSKPNDGPSNTHLIRRISDTEGRRFTVPISVVHEGGEAMEAWFADQPDDAGEEVPMDQPAKREPQQGQ